MNYFNFSATSSEPFYKSKNSQKGGFLGFGESAYTPLLFRAISESNYDTLLFLLKGKEITKITDKDSNDQTILHLLINKYDGNPKALEVIETIIARPDIKDIINVADSNGNTALHLAVMKNMHNLCDELIRVGADPKIRNEAGLLVESVTETQTEGRNGAILTEVSVENGESKNAVAFPLSETSVAPQSGGAHSVFIKRNSASSVKSNNSSATSTAKGFTDFLNDTATMTGGKNNFSEYSELINTNEFINDFIRKNVHTGGAKKKTRKLNEHGSRLELPMSQTSAFNMESSESDNSSSLDEMSELSRMINNQASEIHDRAVKKILELLKEMNGKATEQEARAVKAIIYNQVKESNPELNNFDRAVEMEKRITKETIENIDSKKIKEITNIMAEKQKERLAKQESSEEPKKKTTKTTKATKEPKETKAKETKKKATKAASGKKVTKTKKSKKFIGEGSMKDSSSTTSLGSDSDSSDTLSTSESTTSSTSD